MNEDERRIRLRTNLVILTPGDRGYQDWQDKRILLALLDEARRTNTPGTAPGPDRRRGGSDDRPTVP